jgi:hypothetical protein
LGVSQDGRSEYRLLLLTFLRACGSLLLHHSVLRFPDISENQSKTARVRAICAHAWTWRTSPAALIARIGQNLSRRDFVRSISEEGRLPGDLLRQDSLRPYLRFFSRRCEETLPTSQRRSDECPRRQGVEPCPRRRSHSNTDVESVPGALVNQSGKSVAPAKKTGRRWQAETRSYRESRNGCAASAAVVGWGVQGGEAGLPILRQR